MDLFNQLLALVATHNYLGIAVPVIGYLTYLLSDQSKFPISIPLIFGRDPKPVIAVVLGIVGYTIADRQAGHTWLDAAKLGLIAGVATMGLFDVIVKFGFNGDVPMWLKQLLLLFPKPEANALAVVIPPAPGLPTVTAVAITDEVAPPKAAVKPKPPSVPPGITMLVGVLLSIATLGVILTGCAWYKANQPALTTLEDEVCVFGAEEAGLSPEASALACKLGVDAVNGLLAKKHEKAGGFKRAMAASHDGGAPKDAGTQ